MISLSVYNNRLDHDGSANGIGGKTRTKNNRESGISDIEALSTALREEQVAKEYYVKQASLMTDAAAKEMYLRLAEMEDAHYQIIEAEIDSIKGTGFWLGFPKFTMD